MLHLVLGNSKRITFMNVAFASGFSDFLVHINWSNPCRIIPTLLYSVEILYNKSWDLTSYAATGELDETTWKWKGQWETGDWRNPNRYIFLFFPLSVISRFSLQWTFHWIPTWQANSFALWLLVSLCRSWGSSRHNSNTIHASCLTHLTWGLYLSNKLSHFNFCLSVFVFVFLRRLRLRKGYWQM